MIILALDTAGPACSVALYDSATDRTLASLSEMLGRGHAERLMPMIEEALVVAGRSLADLGKIAVTIGPGSFTGIRTAVAAARGLSLALDIPVVGITTLALIAHRHIAEHAPDRPVAVGMDAKRGEIWFQLFDATGTPLDEAQALSPDAAAAAVAACGAVATGSGLIHLNPFDLRDPDRLDATLAAKLATRIIRGEPVKPLYLRGPDAKPQAGFAVSRSTENHVSIDPQPPTGI